MFFVCHPRILHRHCFSFSRGHFNSQEKLKTMLMQNFGVTNKEHYGMLWYFWSGQYQSSCATRLASEIEHWFSCGADGRTDGRTGGMTDWRDGGLAGWRAVYCHVITKFSGMGRFTYPWCSVGALRAPELRYNFS